VKLWPLRREEQRVDPAISLQSWLELVTSFSYNGVSYTLPGAQQEEIRDYVSLIRQAFKSCVVVFACMDVRCKLFSEATFQWRDKTSHKLFGDASLGVLEHPWPGGTTGDLLFRMLQSADLSGNAFVARLRQDRLSILRPDWVDIISASPNSDASVWDLDAQVIGYLYWPRGRTGEKKPIPLLPEQVAHYAPIPDPESRFRGTSWLWPALNEVMADKAATMHKLRFFENGATPNLVVKFDLDTVEKMRPWIELFKEGHEGALNAYKTLFINSTTSVDAVGAMPEQIDFKVTQGAGETRIAAAAGVPPVVVGLSEGLNAATYSNYAQARRRFADGTMRPLWREACGCLENIVPPPNSGAELWYDEADIPALQEDVQDAAAEMKEKAAAAFSFIQGGWDPDSIVAAIDSGDLTLLSHSGMTSVQLHAPGETPALPPGPQPEVAVTNGASSDGGTNG
jgi:phage portal protein BeeE